MSIKFRDNPGVFSIWQENEVGTGQLHLSDEESHELLEALARARGFTLVDRDQRQSLMALIRLMALTDEVLDEHPDDAPVHTWRTLAKTMASTVADALRFENEA